MKFDKYIKKIKKQINNIIHPKKEESFNTIEVVVVIVISILFGIIVGCILTYGKGYAKSTSGKYTEELINTYETIVENYYNEDGVSEEKLVDAAINGMLNSLGDNHSYYMDPNETYSFNQEINGSYIGVGATIGYKETGNYVVEVFENSPADKAGLKVGDVILDIDGTSVVGYALDEISPLLIGEKDTKVKIKIKRGDKEKNVTVVRGAVVIPSVHSKVVKEDNKNIGYIDIDRFAANTYSQFNKNLKELEKENIDSLIIDVRDNLGGNLNQVEKILSLFFDKKTVLYQIGTKDSTKKVYSSSKEKREYDVVVLINYSSASASEILASSFQDNYKNAVIVGTKSYGKGTVQSTIKLSTGASLKYTSQRWLTSKGVWIDGTGIIPDEEVLPGEDLYENASDSDIQFKKAIEILSK